MRGQFDLSLGYQLTPQVQLRGAVQNLTNTRVDDDMIGRYSTVVPQTIDGAQLHDECQVRLLSDAEWGGPSSPSLYNGIRFSKPRRYWAVAHGPFGAATASAWRTAAVNRSGCSSAA